MVYRLRISRTHKGKERFYTAFGEGFTSKKKARDSGKRMKKSMGVKYYRVVKRKTKGDLRNYRHKFPLSRYRTQTQPGTSRRRRR